MDNLEGGTVDPQEAADVNAASGQSTENVETQATEDTTSVDGTAVEAVVDTGKQPWESDDRFKGKTAEEMYQIVKEADEYKGKLSQKAKVADLLSAKYGLTPERMAELVQERAESERQEQIQSNPLGHLNNRIEELEEQLIIKEEDSKLEQFLASKPEYAPFKNELRELGYSVHRDMTWDAIADRYFSRAINVGREEAYKKLEIKQKTQATGVSQGETKKSLTLEDLQGMSASEMESYLPRANRF